MARQVIPHYAFLACSLGADLPNGELITDGAARML
jgi:hypothetical protein